jgi:predicted GIY-YIG superfamily endonuclease
MLTLISLLLVVAVILLARSGEKGTKAAPPSGVEVLTTSKVKFQLNGETHLYRFYDDSGNLLYVGVTNSLESRFSQHQKDKPWYHQVSEIKTETYPTRDAALWAERDAIKLEKPIYNIIHNRNGPIEY